MEHRSLLPTQRTKRRWGEAYWRSWMEVVDYYLLAHNVADLPILVVVDYLSGQ